MDWMQKAISSLTLTGDVNDYLLARGGKSDWISSMQLKTWDSSVVEEVDSDFKSRFSSSRLDGMLCIPSFCPQGKIHGLEFRSIHKKLAMKHYGMRTKWNPVWVGVPGFTEKIYRGASVWIVEGLFDLFAMSWVVPDHHVILSTERVGLTSAQLDFLSRWVQPSATVYVVYDNDEAGRNAVHTHEKDGVKKYGILDKLKRIGLSCIDVKYSGKDPGEVWDQGGRELITATFAHVPTF